MTGIELWMFWTSISDCEIPPVEMAADIARLPQRDLVIRHDGAVGGPSGWGHGVEEYRLRCEGEHLPLNPSIVRALKRRVTNGWKSHNSDALIEWARSKA